MNLRDRLRMGTRRAQDALDGAFSRFDLETTAGLAAFLSTQADMVATLREGGDAVLAPALDAAAKLIAADLAELGHMEPPTVLPLPKIDEAVARIWLWHATRLGTRMQARRIAAGLPDAAISAPRDSTAWRVFCDDLEEREGYGAAPDREMSSVNDWYALFETTCHARARAAMPPTA